MSQYHTSCIVFWLIVEWKNSNNNSTSTSTHWECVVCSTIIDKCHIGVIFLINFCVFHSLCLQHNRAYARITLKCALKKVHTSAEHKRWTEEGTHTASRENEELESKRARARQKISGWKINKRFILRLVAILLKNWFDAQLKNALKWRSYFCADVPIRLQCIEYLHTLCVCACEWVSAAICFWTLLE